MSGSSAAADSFAQVWQSYVQTCEQALLAPRVAATAIDYTAMQPNQYAVSADRKMITLTEGDAARYTIFVFSEVDQEIESTCSMSVTNIALKPDQVGNFLSALDSATVVGGFQPAIVPDASGQFVQYPNYSWSVRLPHLDSAGAKLHVQHDTHSVVTLTGFGSELP